MGFWGTGIFDNDITEQVRSDWREAILEGIDPKLATRRLVARYQAHTPDEESLQFWLGLALAQHETGRLQDDVRARALAIIESGADIEGWAAEDPALGRRRARVLKRLDAKLRGRQPKPKRLRRPRQLGVRFEVGDVVLLRNVEQRVDALFSVVANDRDEDPIVAPLLWHGGATPSPAELARIPPVLCEYYAWWLEGSPVVRIAPCVYFVTTNAPDEAFGPAYGEVVAQGVARSDIEPRTDASQSWPTLRDWIGSESFRGYLHDTPRLAEFAKEHPPLRAPWPREGFIPMAKHDFPMLKRAVTSD